MTQDEFDATGAYITELWPEFTLTTAQREIWWDALRPYSTKVVRRSMARAYKESKWKIPMLADVCAILSEQTRTDLTVIKGMPDAEAQRLIEADMKLKHAYATTMGVEVAKPHGPDNPPPEIGSKKTKTRGIV